MTSETPRDPLAPHRSPSTDFGESAPESLHEQLENIKEKLENLDTSSQLPEVPTEEEIEARIRSATGGRDLKSFRKSVDRAQRGGADAPSSRSKSDYRGAGMGLFVAYVLLGLPMAGAALGWLVDRWLGITWGVGAGTLIMAVIALVYVILVLNRENQS